MQKLVTVGEIELQQKSLETTESVVDIESNANTNRDELRKHG